MPLQIEPRRILFVLSGLIGDSVMCLPAIFEASRIWPNAKISVLGKSHNRDLLLAEPTIHEFYVCDADPFSLRKRRDVRQLRLWLESSHFDIAFILLGDQFAYLLADSGIRIRVGVKGTLLEPCLTHTYQIGSPREWGVNERMNALRTLGCQVSANSPKLFVIPEAAEAARKKLMNAGLPEREGYLVLHPFGSTRRQWWPLRNIPNLVEEVYRSSGKKMVLIGGRETCFERIDSERIIDTRGQFSIAELLAVIEGAEMVITTDSGPFHLAGALGKQIVGLFRHRRPEHANAYSDSQIILGNDARCRSECEWDKCATDTCRQMENISVADVSRILSKND